MERKYRVFDIDDEDLYLSVDSYYFNLSDAKQSYLKSKVTDKKDDSIMIEVAKHNAKEVEYILNFGVEEGEKFALALLNLCHLIKYKF